MDLHSTTITGTKSVWMNNFVFFESLRMKAGKSVDTRDAELLESKINMTTLLGI